MLKKLFLVTLCLVFSFILSIKIYAADTVKLNGSSTVYGNLIEPFKAAVEKKAGITIEAIKTGTGPGLKALINKECDAAMTSDQLDIAKIAAGKAGAEIKDDLDLQISVICQDECVFIVNKSNPVEKLTWKQITDIFSGKITNWKELGGSDAEIVIYGEDKTGGTSSMIQKVVMKNAKYLEKYNIVAQKSINDKVAEDVNGFGGLSGAFAVSEKIKTIQSEKLKRPLGFITIGDPSANIQKLIDAFTEEFEAGQKK